MVLAFTFPVSRILTSVTRAARKKLASCVRAAEAMDGKPFDNRTPGFTFRSKQDSTTTSSSLGYLLLFTPKIVQALIKGIHIFPKTQPFLTQLQPTICVFAI
ncbi:hypothetical protein BABINDRAFT_89910 [Babjeviella inositovora NRRL Y-12698]|uniref:Uncharacterized protein n=1 Tax=Babjeviella inositovora NRRL Y-12698 TaxID=984486 RepID=A0A1E3QMT9_9ASCO|nr:uncharacterized protein BABINDRAFT_89910 [Babjeviella inositovora NRRL Y-12698]ODQ78317.1 hypothetical protein BABINDRAFT_89910 [Babjeviella inositovora NRRL Y-12698]